MNNRNRERLIECECKLLRAGILPDEQVEQIIAAPHLFKAVRARIEAEKATGKTVVNNIDSHANRAAKVCATNVWQRIIGLKNLRLIAVAAAVLVVIGAGFAWRIKTTPVITALPEDFVETAATQLNVDSPPFEGGKLNINPPIAPVKSTAALISARNRLNKSLRPAFQSNANQIESKFLALRTKQVDKVLRKKLSAPKEFYQLAFAGALEPNETKQIVRVKLSPGALVQLGADAPVALLRKNEITADLLLGEDGTPRAIRYVN